MYGHGTAELLLSMVAGYWVLERAATHKGRLRALGRLIGGLILIVALVGTVCRIWFITTGAHRPFPRSLWCPWKSGSPEPAPPLSDPAA